LRKLKGYGGVGRDFSIAGAGSMSPEGRRWVFHGRVQGVGFRVTTCRLAAAFPVRGHVRNQPDGTVEVAAWGDPAVLVRFEAAILREFDGYIYDHVGAPLAESGPIPSAFTIRY
jgi:acylphosphatase